MPWVAGAIFLAPAAGTVLVDTGSLPAGQYNALALITYNPTGFECQFQVTAADGVTVLSSKIIPVTLALMPLVLSGQFLKLQAGEHLRIVNRAAAPVGTEVEASLFYALGPSIGA